LADIANEDDEEDDDYEEEIKPKPIMPLRDLLTVKKDSVTVTVKEQNDWMNISVDDI